jgi:hypothetical protein
VTITTRICTGTIGLAAFAVALASPVLAGEEVREHETYEKRTMKIETVPLVTTTTAPPNRVYEHREEETTTMERRTAQPPPAPAPVVKERSSETVHTEETR